MNHNRPPQMNSSWLKVALLASIATFFISLIFCLIIIFLPKWWLLLPLALGIGIFIIVIVRNPKHRYIRLASVGMAALITAIALPVISTLVQFQENTLIYFLVNNIDWKTYGFLSVVTIVLTRYDYLQWYSSMKQISNSIERQQENRVQQGQINNYSGSTLSGGVAGGDYTNTNQSRNITVSGETVNVSGAGAFSLGDNTGIIANTINKNPSLDETVTTEQVIELIAELKNTIASYSLPDKDQQSLERDIEEIEAQLVTEQPDKEEVKYSLKNITRKINKLNLTADVGKQLSEKIKPVVSQIVFWAR